MPMSFLRAKPIGVMQMLDQGEQDDKVIAVHADDPEFRGFNDISELPKHRLAEIRRCEELGSSVPAQHTWSSAEAAPVHRFFEDYKKNENKEVKVDEILGVEAALQTIRDSMVSPQLCLGALATRVPDLQAAHSRYCMQELHSDPSTWPAL